LCALRRLRRAGGAVRVHARLHDRAGRLSGRRGDGRRAEALARDARRALALPEHSIQNPVLVFMPHDLVGAVARMRPFMGQLGTTPAVDLPDSHNAGDFGAFLVGAPHARAVTAQQLELRTDGHMDIDAVRAGSILVCPVKVAGGGVYLGDMHAMQGDGEIAGHTADVAGTVTLQVEVAKGLSIDGPVLFPVAEDLPFPARPLTVAERARAEEVAAANGVTLEQTLPISVVGSGPDLNAAVANGLARAGSLLGMQVAEVMNRATITGAIEIGRAPGIVQVTFRAPVERLDACGLGGYAREQYGPAR
jgi:formamidase